MANRVFPHNNQNVYGSRIAVARSELTLNSNPPGFYGSPANPLFDCDSEDAVVGLSFAGVDPFLDWLTWEPTNNYLIKKNFINFIRPKFNGGVRSSGIVADPCADPNTYELDVCDFILEGFARLRRGGPVRDSTMVGVQHSWNQPRYRLDGSEVLNDREFDILAMTEVLLQDLRNLVINGNSATPGDADGLNQFIKIDYENTDGTACKLMNSIIVDWNGNGLDGGSGIAWNGAAIGTTVSFISVLNSAVARIRGRIRNSPTLNAQTMVEGNMILLVPNDYISSVLDAYTCWAVCAGDWNSINTFEARTFRNNLEGGMFGAGTIRVNGFPIPIVPFDVGMTGEDNFSIKLLTGAVGNIRILNGQYNDLTKAVVQYGQYVTDGGRILTWQKHDHTCEQNFMEMRPRLICWAPWAQASFDDIAEVVPGGIESNDPSSPNFPY